MRSTFTLHAIFHVSSLKLFSKMLAQFEFVYQKTEFIERDTFLIWSPKKTVFDFDDFAWLAGSLQDDSTRLKWIATIDFHDLMFTTWLLDCCSSEDDSFWKMLTNNRKANQAKAENTDAEFDSPVIHFYSVIFALKTKCWNSQIEIEDHILPSLNFSCVLILEKDKIYML